MNPANVTACIVTRGNVDLAPIRESLIFPNVTVWDNSAQADLGVAGRYAAARYAPTDTVWFQDDDVIVPPDAQRAMLAAYRPGELLSNMEHGRHRDKFTRLVWLGFGSLVDRALPEDAFARWRFHGGDSTSEAFRLVGCDVVVAMLTPTVRGDFGLEHQPYAFGNDRVYKRREFAGWKRDFYEDALRLARPLKLNLGCGGFPLDGFVNLDADNGWRFEDGLAEFGDGTVDAITVSHALMYVPVEQWPAVFAEFARVLAPDGVVRISEDDTADPRSARYGGYPGAVTLTFPGLVRGHLRRAGLHARRVGADETGYRDSTLVQHRHGDAPKVFFVEAAYA